jgi:hypothetical protein
MDRKMIGAFLLAISISITVIAVWKNNFTPLKLIAGMSWILPLIYVLNAAPTFLTGGTNLQTATVVILIGIIGIMMIWAFRSNLQVTLRSSGKDGKESSSSFDSSGWHLPKWMNTVSSPYRQETGRKRSQSMNERYSEHRQQVHESLFLKQNTVGQRRRR